MREFIFFCIHLIFAMRHISQTFVTSECELCNFFLRKIDNENMLGEGENNNWYEVIGVPSRSEYKEEPLTTSCTLKTVFYSELRYRLIGELLSHTER